MHNQTILISGAGIAGPTLAFWLNAAGFVPTLIERSPELRSGGYVIDFWGLGYDIAERMGLKQDIDRIGYHVREMRIVGNQGNRIAKFPTRIFEDFTEGRYVTLARSGLSRLLFEKVQDTTEVIFNDEIIGIEERTDRVQVRLKHQGERRFDLVVGADGLHSAVRRLAFGPQDQFELSLGYAVAAFEVRGYKPRDEDVYLMYGQPGLMVGRFTLHDNRTLFLFVFTADSKRLPDTTGLQKRLLRERYDTGMWECRAILDALDCTHELYLERVSQIKMENWSRGRIALVGDAAFCVSLLAGQGSALAMISAYVLAAELAKSNGQHREAFRNYEQLLRGYIIKKQEGAAQFASALVPKTYWGLWFRNQVVKAFVIPGVARHTIGDAIADNLRLPDAHWPFNITNSGS